MCIVYFIDGYVEQFSTTFNKYYEEAINTDFNSLTLQQQVKYIKYLCKVMVN